MLVDLIFATALNQAPLPPAAPRVVSRPFSVTLGMGGGFLALDDSIGVDASAAWAATIRVAGGFAANWSVFAGLDYTNAPRHGLAFGNTILQLGLQRYIIKRFYLRAGVGPAWVTAGGEDFSETVGPGWGFAGGVGYEAAQIPGVALGLELRGAVSSFTHENWHACSLNAFATFH